MTLNTFCVKLDKKNKNIKFGLLKIFTFFRSHFPALQLPEGCQIGNQGWKKPRFVEKRF